VKMLDEYAKAPGVTRTRLYLEMIEEVLPGLTIFVMDDAGSVLRFLPLQGEVSGR